MCRTYEIMMKKLYDRRMDIRGKTALVTGAAKRVGRVIALELARRGADVVLHYHRSKDAALATQKEIKSLGVHCHLLHADLADTAHVAGMARELDKSGVRVGILVNSASIFEKTPLESVREGDWERFLDTNLKSCFTLSRELGLRMLKAGGGKIVNIADWSGFRPYKGYVPYCTSKGGLLTLTKALARDLAPTVAVNAVAPGPVLKPEELSQEESQKVVQSTPLGRWGRPEDVAYAVAFLVENDFVNGTVLVVDGGRSIV